MNRKIIVHDDCDKTLQIKELKELVYLTSYGKKTRTICSEGREYLVKKCLSEVEDILPEEKFFKIHKSFIINIDYLRGINVNSHKTVLLQNGIELNIAHRKYKDFMDFIKSQFEFWS